MIEHRKDAENFGIVNHYEVMATAQLGARHMDLTRSSPTFRSLMVLTATSRSYPSIKYWNCLIMWLNDHYAKLLLSPL